MFLFFCSQKALAMFRRNPLIVLLLVVAVAESFILRDVMEPIHSLASMNTSALTPSLTSKKTSLTTWLNQQTKTCPSISDSDEDVHSACPWEEVRHIDHSRRPVTITKAVCQCQHCVNFNTGDRSASYGTCQEIIRPMKVLRKIQDGNSTEPVNFVLDIELVPVACGCSTVDTLVGRDAYSS